MKPEGWNILATAKDRDQRHLARRLKRFGDFHWTAFRGVLIGRVEDQEAFLEQLLRCEEAEPGFLGPLAKLVPINQTFEFTVETFPTRLKEAILPYAERLGSGSFYVRIERRGHAGELHSQHLEQEMDQALGDAIRAGGGMPRIDFKDPDAIVVAETLGDLCGVGMITRAMRSRFPFVHVP
ncbi:MAG: THUMP domain-containing protein [Nitrospirota bacterium]